MKHFHILIIAAALFAACSRTGQPTIPIISWSGIAPSVSGQVFPLVKEAGIDIHLGFYDSGDAALEALEIARESGIRLIVGCPEIEKNPESAVAKLKDNPALFAYHLKDEPEIWDLDWLGELAAKYRTLDPDHMPYINLYPNWAWGNEKYAENIETFAKKVDMPFYSFDQYPVTMEDDGSISVRPTWYENLELFSDMARRHGRPFWAFALSTSHHLGAPSPEAFYPEPTLGHLRLQVFSDLLYGAQAIQYFTFYSLYDPKTFEKTNVFDLVRQVNSEIKAYSPVFYGCEVKGVWHLGEKIPQGTCPLDTMPDERMAGIEISGNGGLVSLISNKGKTYLAVQNRDCTAPATLKADLRGRTSLITPSGHKRYDGSDITLAPGDMAIFQLR